MIYTFDVVLTQDLYDDLHKRWYRQNVLKPFAFYGLGFLAFLVGAVGFGEMGFKGDKGFISGFFVAALGAYSLWFALVTKQAKQGFRQKAQLQVGKSVRYELNDEGVKHSDERNALFYPWNEFKGYQENEMFWLLCVAEWQGVYIPSAALNDEMKRFIKSNLFK